MNSLYLSDASAKKPRNMQRNVIQDEEKIFIFRPLI